jgi:hypothetical protein
VGQSLNPSRDRVRCIRIGSPKYFFRDITISLFVVDIIIETIDTII